MIAAKSDNFCIYLRCFFAAGHCRAGINSGNTCSCCFLQSCNLAAVNTLTVQFNLITNFNSKTDMKLYDNDVPEDSLSFPVNLLLHGGTSKYVLVAKH